MDRTSNTPQYIVGVSVRGRFIGDFTFARVPNIGDDIVVNGRSWKVLSVQLNELPASCHAAIDAA